MKNGPLNMKRLFPMLATTAAVLLTLGFIARAQQANLLQEGFRRGDTDGDGKISVAEPEANARLKSKVAGADKDGDSSITFEEFRAHLAGAVPKPAPPMPDGNLSAGDHTRTIHVGETERRYRIYIPAGYDAAKVTPVVFVFHGGGGNPQSMIRLTGMNSKADVPGFIVVNPFGSGVLDNAMLTFNGGECCGYAMQRKIDDVGFTRALLDDLAKVANVDANRVFATGLSNGGIVSHYVASELSDRIAASAPIGGPLMMPAPNAKRPVSVMHFHGTADAFAPFKGGYGKNGTGGKGVTDFRSVEHTIQCWVKANGCNPEPQIAALPDKVADGMKVTRKTWSGGKDGSEVVLIEIEGGGHTWPGMKPIVALLGASTMDISANDLMWEFFQKHPLKPASKNP